MAQVTLEQIRKSYDNKAQVINDLSLTIADREFVVLVGPSGCGKSTVLRMIAGLETVTDGEIRIEDRRVNDVPPKDRDIAMVFQNYALYPHMSVYDNMAFGLKMRKVAKTEIDAKVKDAARILDLTHLLDRKPKQLSGGQRQRVALGRAIVRNPKVFLMDEPLSNLDAKLRVQMRSEIRKLHQRLSATTIYVTHDQVEAMTMGDRIVILNQGKIQQVDRPLEVYLRPHNLFVAGFIGQMNFLNAVVNTMSSEHPQLMLGDQTSLALPSQQRSLLTGKLGTGVILGLRPEHFAPAPEYAPGSTHPQEGWVEIQITPEQIELLGSDQMVHFSLAGTPVIAQLPPDEPVTVGQRRNLWLNLTMANLFDPTSELRLQEVPVPV